MTRLRSPSPFAQSSRTWRRSRRSGPTSYCSLLPYSDAHRADPEEDTLYQRCKGLALARGLPSQALTWAAVRNPAAIGNIVLGMLAKTGSMPFVLADPLPYADVVVGIDVARRARARLGGSINVAAVTRVYANDGQLLHYMVQDGVLEGETLPRSLLQRLFPASIFAGKRAVIHRDGPFRGEEVSTLQAWGFADATPRPLSIRAIPPFTLEDAAHSVLALAALHHGSLRPPRLPIPLHYSDQIAALALDGLVPRDPRARCHCGCEWVT